MPLRKAGALVAQAFVRRAAGAGHQAAVERPYLAGQLPFVVQYFRRLSGIAVLLRRADAIARGEREHHARRFLKPRIEHAFDFPRGADINPAGGGEPDQAGSGNEDQEQSAFQRIHDATGLIRYPIPRRVSILARPILVRSLCTWTSTVLLSTSSCQP